MVRITSGLGPMNLMPGGLADFGEVGVLAEKSVAGMNGIDVGDLRRADDRRNIEIAARALRRPDADGLVGEADVQVNCGRLRNRRRRSECRDPCRRR